MQTFREFAEQYRLRLNDKKFAARYRLSAAEPSIPGKHGELVDMGDEGLFRLRLLAMPRNARMDKALNARREQALAGGLILKVRSGAESVFYFDPATPAEAELAITLVGARRRKLVTLSDEQRRVISERLTRARATKAA